MGSVGGVGIDNGNVVVVIGGVGEEGVEGGSNAGWIVVDGNYNQNAYSAEIELVERARIERNYYEDRFPCRNDYVAPFPTPFIESMVTLHEFLVECADASLEMQDPDTGAMPAGHNGPWNDRETPVRNTGHWAITFLKAYELSDEERFLEAAEHAVDYLLREEARPSGATFHHLTNPEKYRCNGLVGQAWTIETLVTAADALDRPELIDLATEVFLLHSFDERLRCWRSTEIDGLTLTFDMTFNHQLWFAAAGGMLAGCDRAAPEVDRQVRAFLDELEATMDVRESGLINHPVKPEFDPIKYATVVFDNCYRGSAVSFLSGVLGATTGDGMLEKEIGYHSFNLYGLALLHERYPDHPFWESEKLERALEYGRSLEFRSRLDGNPYGYGYNVSGIEMAYVEHVLGDGNEDVMADWLGEQFGRSYDPETRGLTRNVSDPVTVTARLYELTRLPNLEFECERVEAV